MFITYLKKILRKIAVNLNYFICLRHNYRYKYLERLKKNILFTINNTKLNY